MTVRCYPKCTTCQKARKQLDERPINIALQATTPSFECAAMPA